MNTRPSITCLLDLFLSPPAFFNPNTTAAILDSGVYPSFFFFSLYACEHTHTHSSSPSFFVRSDDIRWETREKTVCVCVHYFKIRDVDRHKEKNG